jgi:hypothetical protein
VTERQRVVDDGIWMIKTIEIENKKNCFHVGIEILRKKNEYVTISQSKSEGKYEVHWNFWAISNDILPSTVQARLQSP